MVPPCCLKLFMVLAPGWNRFGCGVTARPGPGARRHRAPRPSAAGAAGVHEQAAVVAGRGAEHVAALHLEPVDLEAPAALGEHALVALEVGVLDGVDRARGGR